VALLCENAAYCARDGIVCAWVLFGKLSFVVVTRTRTRSVFTKELRNKEGEEGRRVPCVPRARRTQERAVCVSTKTAFGKDGASLVWCQTPPFLCKSYPLHILAWYLYWRLFLVAKFHMFYFQFFIKLYFHTIIFASHIESRLLDINITTTLFTISSL
jgi:hypothetical protein